jgi:hypothetical protein
MAIKPQEWTQNTWVRAGIQLFKKKGDYYSLSNLILSKDRTQLRRFPSWSSLVRTDTNGLSDVQGMFYDHENERVVLLGEDSDPDLASCYLSSAWSLSGISQLHGSPTNLGGLSGRNVLYYCGYLYVIGSNGKLYQGTDYTSTMTELDLSATHRVLAAIDDRVYSGKSDGGIERTAADLASTTSYVVPDHPMDIRAMFPYRSNLLVICRASHGGLDFYTLDVNADTRFFNQQSSQLLGGIEPSIGCLYTLHHDQVFFSPGFYTRPGGQVVCPIYAYNYNPEILHFVDVEHDPNTGGSGVPTSAGLISWRGKLLYYALEGTVQTFKEIDIVNKQVLDFPSLSATAPTTPIAANCGGYLVATADDTYEGVHYMQDTDLDDAVYVSSWMDMGHPARQKRLEKITVVLSDKAASFQTVVKYRKEDETSWSTIDTQANTTLFAKGDQGIHFYLIQFQITLDDNTGNDEDIRIDAISAIYSLGDG